MTADIVDFDKDDIQEAVKRCMEFGNLLIEESGISPLVVYYAMGIASAEIDLKLQSEIFEDIEPEDD